MIPTLEEAGIVYTLTKRDAKQVADWLTQNEIDARPYYGGIENAQELENLLLNNEVKALVATEALGMGYDKPDLGFVIHYQMPKSLVTYYQQVGRAGRGIDNAVGVLMSGEEDQHINKYFRDSAFPSQDQVNQILQVLEEGPDNGLHITGILQEVNLPKRLIENALRQLSVKIPAPVIQEPITVIGKKSDNMKRPMNISNILLRSIVNVSKNGRQYNLIKLIPIVK